MSNTKNILEYTQELKDYFAEKKAVAPVEANASAASKAYAAGDSLWLNNILYNVTATIAQGGALTPGTNLEVAPDIETQLSSLKEANTNLEESLLGKVLSTDPYVLRKGLGNLADMALVGGSVAWNQLVQNGNFASTSNWTVASNDTFTVANNVGTFKASSAYHNIGQQIDAIAGHKIFYTAIVKSYTASNTKMLIRLFTSLSPASYSDVSIDLPTTKAVKSGIIAIGSNIIQTRLMFQDNNASDWGNIEISNVMVIDLTQAFGTTVADYIYNLEQTTAGAGVAWFRQYFPNAYYAYNAGEIQNVRVESRKVVGKNLLRIVDTSRTVAGITYTVLNDGTVIANGTATNQSVFILTSPTNTTSDLITDFSELEDKRVTVSGCPSGGSTSTYRIMIASITTGSSYANDIGGGATFTMRGDTSISIRIGVGTTVNNLVFKPMIRLASVTDDTFEPYKEYTFPFDTTKQLRGIPKLVNNKLSYDGDIYTAEGSITRKYGIVNLGTLNWYYQSTAVEGSITGRFITSPITTAIASSSNMITAKYQTVVSSSYMNDKCCRFDSGRNFIVTDTSYTDAATFKTAMSGVYLVYELATPTTESATAYQNPQRAFTDGTEEFVDYAVSQNTRDVAIPVGNTTTYSLNESAPSLEDYVDGSVENLKAQIKAVVADSSDFADFQTKMAAL